MEFKGKISSMFRDMVTRNWSITISTDQDISEALQTFSGKEIDVKLKQHREKRSLDANAYYWQLVTKLADKLNISKPYLHNILLRRHGRPEVIDGQMVFLVLPDSEEGTKKADEAETYHIRPTSEVKTGKDGKLYRTYVMLRGSSTYDTAEMSALIDGLVSECKEQGIETIPPQELERMMEMYEKNWRKRHEETA